MMLIIKISNRWSQSKTILKLIIFKKVHFLVVNNNSSLIAAHSELGIRNSGIKLAILY